MVVGMNFSELVFERFSERLYKYLTISYFSVPFYFRGFSCQTWKISNDNPDLHPLCAEGLVNCLGPEVSVNKLLMMEISID